MSDIDRLSLEWVESCFLVLETRLNAQQQTIERLEHLLEERQVVYARAVPKAMEEIRQALVTLDQATKEPDATQDHT